MVATDAFSTLGDVHASVHALKLRGVLAVPLAGARRDSRRGLPRRPPPQGRVRPRELAWVRVVASQAAISIADPPEAVLFRRAVRRAERARTRVETLLRERDAELDVTRSQLELARDRGDTRYAYDEIAGRSEPMREMLRLVDHVTASDVPVLIVGESGTGKELVAWAMHSNGPRAKRAFVSENCASVPETLLESTLFGHVRGAFTGASATGLFEVANGGTLFLDEIGEMSLGMQAKLLQVCKTARFAPSAASAHARWTSGSSARPIAISPPWSRRARSGRTCSIGSTSSRCVPPLRERPEDVPFLVGHFVRKHAPDREVKVTRAAMAKLAAYPWPGNVRQLENEVRRSLVLGEGTIDVNELSADIVRGGPSAARGSGLAMRARVDALEKELVVEALAKTRGNQTRAAQQLGLSRFGLHKMMKRLRIKTPVG